MRPFKVIVIFIILLFIFPQILQCQDSQKKTKDLPKIGYIYDLDKTKFLVRGIDNKPFEYKVILNENFAVIIHDLPGAMVFSMKKAQIIKVDSTIPMIWKNRKKDNGMTHNKWLQKNGRNKIFILLEYLRKEN